MPPRIVREQYDWHCLIESITSPTARDAENKTLCVIFSAATQITRKAFQYAIDTTEQRLEIKKMQ